MTSLTMHTKIKLKTRNFSESLQATNIMINAKLTTHQQTASKI